MAGHKTMKNILTINTKNSGGGAEKVAYSLCREFHLRGYNSKMLARCVDYDADSLARELVAPVPGKDWMYSAGNLLDKLAATQYLFYLPTWKIPFLELTRQADVIHLHNMHGSYFNLLSIPLLIAQKPVVWTLHDMWSFTGKCAWSFGCDRFIKSCGKCPELQAYPKLSRDTTRFHLFLKRWLYGRKKFILVTPSRWLQSQVERSILKDVSTHVIHSPIDTRLFFPEERTSARRQLGIPLDKKVILFVASWINSIPHKGIGTFREMLGHLYGKRDDMFTLIVGHLQGKSILDGEFAGKETGWLDSPESLRLCYSSADVFVVPTLIENSSCTIMEGMACGIPIVAYATGGIPEQIAHGETGLLVPTGNKEKLMEAITTILDDPEKGCRFGKAGAERAQKNFAMNVCADKYLNLYGQAMRLKGEHS